MTPAGERVSLYLATPSESDAPTEPVATAMAEASAIVLDLAPVAQRLIPLATASGRPIWTDIHDYDGTADFHRPFIEAADVDLHERRPHRPRPAAVHAGAGRGRAPHSWCAPSASAARSPSRAMRAGGCLATRSRRQPVDVRDTNGAGDAFMTGVLDATLAGAELPDALRAGAEHAASVLGTRHLHPSLDARSAPERALLLGGRLGCLRRLGAVAAAGADSAGRGLGDGRGLGGGRGLG